jgi:hypothetical protein
MAENPWNNYCWQPKDAETEVEVPLDSVNKTPTSAPIIFEDEWEESLWDDEEEFDEDLDETGMAG